MPISDPLLLPPDVLIIEVEHLPSRIRERLPQGREPFAVTRPSVRSPSKLVDAPAADLLRRFQQPTTIVDAIIGYCKDTALDARATLEEAYPVLQDCFNAHFLVPADSPEAGQIMPMLAKDDQLGRYRIKRTIRVLDDVELHQAVDPEGASAVIKLLRPEQPESTRTHLEHEGVILEHLDGRAAPRLLDQGDLSGDPWLATQWCGGVSPAVEANAIRASNSSDRYRALISLCGAILEAYTVLHQAGVMHGDIHPDNVLVGRDGRVTLVDFGAAAVIGDTTPTTRMWVAQYLDPLLAQAMRTKATPPPVTTQDEQYSVAALLYNLLSGDHYLDFTLDRDTMLRQIVSDRPLPFSARGITPWPQVESVLAKALEKEPARRYSSMAAMSQAFGEAATTTPSAGTNSTGGPPSEAADVLRAVKAAIGPGIDPHDVTLAKPLSSLSNGAGGIAYACYRLACLERNPKLLAQAERWLSRAAHQDGAGAFETDELTPDTTGLRSPYHRESGLASMAALISQAQGDQHGLHQAVRRFMSESLPPDEALDLTTGRTGTLQGVVLLLEMIPSDAPALRAELLDFGHTTARALWDIVGTYAPVDQCDDLTYTGMAHGWAGVLYAQLRWCKTTGAPVPAGLGSRLAQLAQLAEPAGRGVRWPWRIDGADQGPRTMSGWCNGSAGFVYLWTMASRVMDEPAYMELARSAAWDAFDDANAVSRLCCGLAGRAYALLAFYRESGDVAWRDRALVLAERAAATSRNVDDDLARQSLYRGDVGVALLAADLAHPEGAAMPFFEHEGWPSQGV